ncbi:hypothetical protein ABVT39_001957 [Epinephelus coioides]
MKWSDMDLTDLRGYLGLLILAGLYRSSKPELLPALLATREQARFSSLFVFTDTCALVSYCPKRRKAVTPMSIFHREAAVTPREDQKPQIILDYNSSKRGVNNLDKMTVCTPAKGRQLAGHLFQHYQCVGLQCFCRVDGNQHKLESGEEPEEEEAVLGGAWARTGHITDRSAQGSSLHVSLCQLGSRNPAEYFNFCSRFLAITLGLCK